MVCCYTELAVSSPAIVVTIAGTRRCMEGRLVHGSVLH